MGGVQDLFDQITINRHDPVPITRAILLDQIVKSHASSSRSFLGSSVISSMLPARRWKSQ